MTLSTEQQTARFADLLEKNPAYAPMRHKLPPLWDLSRMDGGMPEQLRAVIAAAHVPTLNWGPRDVELDVPEGTRLVELDANGAYVAAATSARFAHCALQCTGALDLVAGAVPPGYYLVDAHSWQLGAPGSPLGAGRPRMTAEGRVWVPHTVYAVLRDLTHGAAWGAVAGHWPDATVYDSWTADPVQLTAWAGAVRDARAAAKRTQSAATVNGVKVGYSQAVQMWSTPPDRKGAPAGQRKKKNRAYRPDWYHALRGQHAMNMWRRAYQAAVVLDRPPLRIAETDRIWFRELDLRALLGRERAPFPIRLDETEIQLGTFKRTREWYAGIEDM